MNERIITFSANHLLADDKEIQPEPAKLSIPEWYKKIPNPDENLRRTIKACKPFLDSLTAGYILKNPIDQKINFNTPDPNGKNNTWVEVHKTLNIFGELFKNSMNFNLGDETHPLEQIGGMTCPYAKQNKGFNIYKILNPWTVNVPSGYSVFYMPPINRSEDRFEIISGIVDGGHSLPTNFPCVFKKQGSWILEKGTPIASVFPFKRESWKMKIVKDSDKDFLKKTFNYASKLTKWYEKKFWKKNKWN